MCRQSKRVTFVNHDVSERFRRSGRIPKWSSNRLTDDTMQPLQSEIQPMMGLRYNGEPSKSVGVKLRRDRRHPMGKDTPQGRAELRMVLDGAGNSRQNMRMKHAYDLSAPKRATNLTVNSDLLAQAKALGINISAVLEQSLAEKVKKLRADAWLRDNQEAIHAYNQDVEQNGTFGDSSRQF